MNEPGKFAEMTTEIADGTLGEVKRVFEGDLVQLSRR